MKLIKLIVIFLVFSIKFSFAYDVKDFDEWKLKFKKIALKNDISNDTFDIVMSNVKYLPKVIEYDRFQPEFYEDTKYISKEHQNKSKTTELIFIWIIKI